MNFVEVSTVSVLNQRMRRVLSVLRTVAAHMCRQDGLSGESALHLSGRIGAIGRIVLAPIFADGVDLELLVLDEPLLRAARPEQFSAGGAEVRLAPKAAELMSLAVHELATNAVKYGALSQSRAKIRVAWDVEIRVGVRILRFEWLESAVTMSHKAPLVAGFGCELVERVIARELKGEGKMFFLPDGVRCSIDIPLSDGGHRHE
jgi:hypothetical protein